MKNLTKRQGAHLFFVEDVVYQKAAVQEMERAMLPVVPMRPTTDKRSGLQVVAPYIRNGTVLFPRTGCEELLGQIFNLGVESHDDLCDGLTILLQGLVQQGLSCRKSIGSKRSVLYFTVAAFVPLGLF
jgi:phage terminase large subunit-like protein